MSDEPNEQEGCRYRERKGVIPCNKLCDPGHQLCPFHTLLVESSGAKFDGNTMTYKTPRGYQE